MASGKETPRQKMIGMMYLVLMALLALNVSKDVLDAFVLVDESLTTTTENFSMKNEIYYQEFDRAAAENPVKAGPWKAKADEVKRKSYELFQYIQERKLELVVATEGEDTDAIEGDVIHGHEIVGKDNVFKPAEIMITGAKGNDLKMAIDGYRKHLLSLIGEGDESTRESIETSLNTDDPPPVEGEIITWQTQHFQDLPLIAVITLMSKMQSDVRNAESEVLAYLYSQIDAGSFKFNLLEPVVIAKSNHVIRGNEYKADVFMAAFDTTQQPIVYVGAYDSIVADDGTIEYNMVGQLGRDYDSIPIESGKGVFTVPTNPRTPTGWKDWGGIISLKRLDGCYTNKPFRSGYTVAAPSLVVSPTAMNVFYQAVDNPVEVSVPGYPSRAIRASINNGRMTGSGSNYTVVPTRLGTAKVSVSVNVDGTTRGMGSKDFRVEKVPDPFPSLAGKKGGTLAKGEILGEMGLKAEMPEWFKFNLEFRITSYTLSANVGGFTQEVRGTSPNFSNEMRQIIRNMRSGSRVYFDDCQAVGPDGATRNIGTCAIKIR